MAPALRRARNLAASMLIGHGINGQTISDGEEAYMKSSASIPSACYLPATAGKYRRAKKKPQWRLWHRSRRYQPQDEEYRMKRRLMAAPAAQQKNICAPRQALAATAAKTCLFTRQSISTKAAKKRRRRITHEDGSVSPLLQNRRKGWRWAVGS